MFKPLLVLTVLVVFALPARAEGLVIPPPVPQPAPTLEDEKKSLQIGKSLIPDDILDCFDHVRGAISAALATGSLKAEELERLDFTLPWNKGYGDNISYEVFNLRGKIQAPLIADGGEFSKEDWEFHFSALTGRENSTVVFNLRRSIDPDGKFEDVLYAIVPDIRRNFYVDNRFTQDVGGHPECPARPVQLIISPDNRQIINDRSAVTQKDAACLVLPDKKAYLFIQLAKRTAATPQSAK